MLQAPCVRLCAAVAKEAEAEEPHDDAADAAEDEAHSPHSDSGRTLRACEAERKRRLFRDDPLHTLDVRGWAACLPAGGAAGRPSRAPQLGPAVPPQRGRNACPGRLARRKEA